MRMRKKLKKVNFFLFYILSSIQYIRFHLKIIKNYHNVNTKEKKDFLIILGGTSTLTKLA